jgi:serine phosphatase RsbU (regulator of sigma subunit)
MRKNYQLLLFISIITVLQLGFAGFFYLSQKYTQNELKAQVLEDNKILANQMVVLLNKTGLTAENPETDSILQYLCDTIKLPNQGFVCFTNAKGITVAAPGLAPGKSMEFNPDLQDIDYSKPALQPKDLTSETIFSGYAHFQSEKRIDIVVSAPFGNNLRIFVHQNLAPIKQKALDSAKPLLLFGLIITFFVIIIGYNFLKKILEEYINQIDNKNKELNELKVKLQKPKQEEVPKKNEEISQHNIELTEIQKKLSDYEINISAFDLYTKRIQHSILSKSVFNHNLIKENFILSIPRDVIGGDFYWSHQMDDLLFLAVADSTGHGSVGALMSIYASNLLNETIIEKQIKDPAIILEYISRTIAETFLPDYQKNNLMPGYSMAVCVINVKSKEITYSGALMPIICIRNSELIEIKPDMMWVGMNNKTEEEFKNQNFTLQNNDTIYLFSDGFYNQFGGKEGRKFLLKNFKSLLLEIKDIQLAEQKNILEHTIVEWKGKYDQVDDILVIGLKIN